MSKDKALLIIDVQMAMFDESDPVHDGEGLIEILCRVLAEARAAGVPVIYVQHNENEGAPLEPGQPGWDIHHAIKPKAHDIVIQKRKPDSFYGTTLKQELDDRGIRELIIAGMQTDVCVDTTCRCAYSHGYKITLLSDAHRTWPSSGLTADQIIAHHNAVLRLFADVKESKYAFGSNLESESVDSSVSRET
ncbi:cysteine hydrolase [Paenibacillus sp. MER 180]|uniref:cysteine hydrolase family protein n=1 Tax=Paenibacillus sp. MER 180 TaxID=2939570 RepID=UPI00203BB834|nr:cysteine hydrolase family protein [Paenibacillus sp. MER 180]MCM3293055.1 cysteine hydrolase [Paenibacillus sp. MER 180]